MSDDLSPLDGRYKSKVQELRAYFSEDALNRYRINVEVEWLIYLCDTIELKGTRALSPKEQIFLRDLYQKFSEKDTKELEKIEAKTNHDVKAIEYFMKKKMAKHSTKDLMEWVHFACTSEDINNVSYALMIKNAMHEVMMPTMDTLKGSLEDLVKKGAKVPMLAHTHGQPASPTTVGKEIANVLIRLSRQIDQLREQEYLAKMNGAVGNWNAHLVAYPDFEWHELSRGFLEKLELECSVYTTQIEPHDYLAELAHTLMRFNTILLDLDRDIWIYISKNYFIQRVVKGEVGSSTMPHKVNPIDFENSEGNLGLTNALLGHLADKLPISRMQRDLSDSTVLRNFGVAFGYSLLAYKSTLRGLQKIDINTRKLAEDLGNHWEVLAEALQTVMRRYGIANPYEKLKKLTRGKGLDQKGYMAFVKTLKIPTKAKERLAKLTPATYTGLAEDLVKQLFA